MPFIQEQNELRDDYKITTNQSPVSIILRKRSTRGIFFLIVFAAVVPVLVYYFIFNKSSFTEDTQFSCSVSKTARVLCGKAENVTFDYCAEIHCCFDNSTKRCYHYLPSKYYYFVEDESTLYKKSLAKTPFGRDMLENVKLTINEIDANKVQIILHDPNLTPNNNTLADKNYFCNVTKNPLSVEILRNESKQVLLTTTKGPMIISDFYWEWSFYLTDEFLFGLGQTLITLDENSTLTKVIYGNGEDHNTLPVFLAYKEGSYHGVLVRHKGPLEVTVLPSNLVTIKSIAGDEIILELTVGPTIKEVLQQQKNSGNDVTLNMLGVHICREGATTNLRSIVNDYRSEKEKEQKYSIKYTSDCFHENLITALRLNSNSNDQENALELIKGIADSGVEFVLSLAPQISVKSTLYQNTKNFNLFFKSDEADDYRGKYLSTDVVYPNFNHPNINDFLNQLKMELTEYFDTNFPSKFILNNNWPTDDFQMENSGSVFQYLSKDLIKAMSNTLPWNVISENQTHIYNHIQYGASHLEKIQSILTKNLITASHTFDTNLPIIIQNVDISWTNFQKTISTILYNSIFGFHLISIPVCGSTSSFESKHESLCLRWYLMAATSPIFRISSDLPKRDPNSLSTDFIAKNAKQAIDFRYSLQYYFYNVLINGEPLMRPMFYDFPDESDAFGLVEQYMVGGDILVAHPTLPDQSLLKIYFPKSVENWFEFNGGDVYNHSQSDNGWIKLSIVASDWIGFIREGSVIPTVSQSEEENTENVKLKIALKCYDDTSCNAIGVFQVDDSNSFTFSSTNEKLTITKPTNTLGANFALTHITIFKAGADSQYLKVDGNKKLIDIDTCTYSDSNSVIC